jgi:hypothetical protein
MRDGQRPSRWHLRNYNGWAGVVFSIYAFAREQDFVYVPVTIFDLRCSYSVWRVGIYSE